MPVIFGKEVSTKTLWIGGGLIAAAVAVVVFLRARASTAPQEAAGAQPAADYGYGGMSVAAPSQQAADQYQQQLQNADLEAASLANQYQKNLITQQERQFNFQMSQEELLAPVYRETAKAQLGADKAYFEAKAKIPIACPPGYARARDADGNLVCNPKGSGNKIVKAVESGVADAAGTAIQAYVKQALQLPPLPNKPKVTTKTGGGYQETYKAPVTQRVGTGGYRSTYDDQILP